MVDLEYASPPSRALRALRTLRSPAMLLLAVLLLRFVFVPLALFLVSPSRSSELTWIAPRWNVSDAPHRLVLLDSLGFSQDLSRIAWADAALFLEDRLLVGHALLAWPLVPVVYAVVLASIVCIYSPLRRLAWRRAGPLIVLMLVLWLGARWLVLADHQHAPVGSSPFVLYRPFVIWGNPDTLVYRQVAPGVYVYRGYLRWPDFAGTDALRLDATRFLYRGDDILYRNDLRTYPVPVVTTLAPSLRSGTFRDPALLNIQAAVGPAMRSSP